MSAVIYRLNLYLKPFKGSKIQTANFAFNAVFMFCPINQRTLSNPESLVRPPVLLVTNLPFPLPFCLVSAPLLSFGSAKVAGYFLSCKYFAKIISEFLKAFSQLPKNQFIPTQKKFNFFEK